MWVPLSSTAETEGVLLGQTSGPQRLARPDRYRPVEAREIEAFNRVTGVEEPG